MFIELVLNLCRFKYEWELKFRRNKVVYGVNFSKFNRNDVKFTFLDKYTSYFIKFVILTLDRSGLWLVRLGNYIEFSRVTLKSGRIPTSTIRQPIHVTKTFLNTNLPKILHQIQKNIKKSLNVNLLVFKK